MRNPVETWRGMPMLVRFLICHAAIGFGLSALLVGGLLLADPNGLGRLLLTAAGHWWPAALLWLFTGMTFGAVQIGIAAALLAEPPRRRGHGAPAMPAPALLRVRAPRRR